MGLLDRGRVEVIARASLAVIVAGCGSQSAQLPCGTATDGVYWDLQQHAGESESRYRLVAGASARRATEIELGPRVTPDTVSVTTINNENSRFVLTVRHPLVDDCRDGVLRLENEVISSSGFGSSIRHCIWDFELTRSQAERAGAYFNIALQERHEIGSGLEASFSPSSVVVDAGSEVLVSLVIENPEDQPRVQIRRGGRQRGPRDNRFDFEIKRDGVSIATIDAMDFGGLGSYHTLGPGERVEVQEHLSRWGDLSVPGEYLVECRYKTKIAPAFVDELPGNQSASEWDRTFRGTIRFRVRPAGRDGKRATGKYREAAQTHGKI